jgi:hypothetical protein
VDQNTLASLAASPGAFRNLLQIPTGRGPARLAGVMAPFQARDFAALDPAFLALARGEKPDRGRFWLERTKGGSKDTDCAVMLLWLLAFGRRPLACQVGAVDQTQAAEVRKAAQDLLRLNGWLADAVQIQSWALLNPRTEARCEIVASDVASSHGARPDLLVLNELSHLTKQDFALNLLDNASKVPSGVVVIASNAGFQPSWQFTMREEARASRRWYFSHVTEPAPWLDPAEVDEARRRGSNNRFRRLWGGEWVPRSGDLLDGETIRAALTLRGPPQPEPGMVFFGGIDLSVSKHHTAVCVVGRDRSRRLRLMRLYSWEPVAGLKVDLRDVREAVLDADALFRPLWVADGYQMQLMAQDLRIGGVRIELDSGGAAGQKERASAVLETFNSRLIDLWDDAKLVGDLASLALVEGESGCRLQAPETRAGGHADRAMALAYALQASRRHPWLSAPADPDAGGAVVLLPGRADPCVDWNDSLVFITPGTRNRTGVVNPDDLPPRPGGGFYPW